MLVFRLRMWFSSLGRTISPARREQERLRIEQEEQIAMARLAVMFETRVEVPALAALSAPAAVEPTSQVRSLKRARVSSRKAKASPAQKTCPDCLETVLKTARSCVYCRYDFVLAESAWPLNGVTAAKVA